MRPIIPNVPFDLPNSIRPLDVTAALGTTAQFGASTLFAAVDPSNNPVTVTNHMINYGWEYVWHCHLLGHEENIMMRPIIAAVAPKAPSDLAATRIGTGSSQKVTLTWTDNSMNEIGFIVQRATASNGPWTTVTTALSSSTDGPGTGTRTYTDTTVARKKTYYYQVIANNVVGDTTVYPAPAVGYPNMAANSAPSNTSNAVTTN